MNTETPLRGSRSIASYALLSDCNSAALVSDAGSIDWLCLPRFDSPATFAGLLDPDAGHWSVHPTGPFRVERRYVPGTLVLETIFTTSTGVVCLNDALAFGVGERVHDLGLECPHEVLRHLEMRSGWVDMVMELAPRPEYGLVRPVFEVFGDGGRTFGGPCQMVVRAGVPVEIDAATMRATFRLQEGENAGFSLRWSAIDRPHPVATAPDQVAARLHDTIAGWQSWEDAHDIYQGAYREQVRLSARVLKGLAYRPTGAIVAAPTTSLPEAVGGTRNWDYRYAWVRDASLTLEALYIGACSKEAEEFVSFVTTAAGGNVKSEEPLQIMYGVGGEHHLAERELAHLRGWRDSQPVRVGNGAWDQSQLDVYGELLNALFRYQEKLGELTPAVQRFVASLADAAAKSWRQKDAGMWEMRGEPRHHLSSKVLCWSGLDRAVRLAPQLGGHGDPEHWARERDLIREAILERGWSEERQAYAQSFDSDDLDAAALLMPLVGFLPASDPRMRSTIEAIARDLTKQGLVLRYRTGDEDNADGLNGNEGSFVICSFWLVACLAQAGEVERAVALFDLLVGYANDLGLLAEEVDPDTGELLGNFPQAFSHVGVIMAAWEIDQARGGDAQRPAPPTPAADWLSRARDWLTS